MALVSFWIRRPRPAAQGRSPFPTTRGLGLGAQERVDFVEGEPAARRGDTRRGHPPSRVGARVTCCPRPTPRVAGQRPGKPARSAPNHAGWSREPAGEGRQLGQSVARLRPLRPEYWVRTDVSFGRDSINKWRGPPRPKRQPPIPPPDFCLDLQCTLKWPQTLEPVHHHHPRAPGTIPEAEE